MKLGSLFDGIGAFPLSAARFGIEPIWASEIESSAIAITRRHFPKMKHLGDITQINGAEIEPVDIITFGSPCTNLSQAGRQNGFNITFQCWGDVEKFTIDEITGDEIPTEPHFDLVVLANDKQKYFYETDCPICGALLQETNESALFFNAARVISEMREATNGVYPRFIIWENVPGAYSSNQGEDFRQVLEEICNIAERGIAVPRPYRGKWKSSGGIVLDGCFSLAWRTLDAQYWGVAQRRRRIFLIADFGGERAGEILFVENGLRGNFAEGKGKGEGVAAITGNGTKASGFNGWRSVTGDIEYEDDVSPCIQSTMPPNVLFENHQQDSRVTGPHDVCPTVAQKWGGGGNNIP
jgi:DNA (cytosine-5)-methyltransferase 1